MALVSYGSLGSWLALTGSPATLECSKVWLLALALALGSWLLALEITGSWLLIARLLALGS
jgi:hypothetical protein